MDKRLKSEIKYFVFYKPYNVLNQFTKEQEDHVTLASFLKVEKDVYPVGRLDKDSEGLLILTNDSSLNALLLSPSQGHKRTYAVQLDNDITQQALDKVSRGVEIKTDTGTYKTQPCTVKKLSKAPVLPERVPPIRVRQNIPTSWALIELKEGKNRQVRKMFAAVGFPVLRLVRVQIEDLKLGKLEPGKYMEIGADELFKLIKIDPSAIQNKRSTSKSSSYKGTKTPTSKASAPIDKKETTNVESKSTFSKFRGDKKPKSKPIGGDAKKSTFDKKSKPGTTPYQSDDKSKSFVKKDTDKKPFEAKPKPKPNKKSKAYAGKPESPKSFLKPKKFTFKKNH